MDRPSKLPLPIGGSGLAHGTWTPSNTWFPGPTRVLNPNDISIDSAIFARLTSVTDRPTDHATRSVSIGRIYVRSTAMQPNNSAVHHICRAFIPKEQRCNPANPVPICSCGLPQTRLDTCSCVYSTQLFTYKSMHMQYCSLWPTI